MQRCAEWLAAALVKAGADHAEVMPTEGNPVVFAEKIIDPRAKTVLVYGHYDVMPVDPREEWHTDPFGASHKGWPHLGPRRRRRQGASRSCTSRRSRPCAPLARPCNVKFMLEGEEEIGSQSLYKFCADYKKMLKADIILVSDTSMISMDTPSITCGLRGLTYMEVEVTGPNKDLHSPLRRRRGQPSQRADPPRGIAHRRERACHHTGLLRRRARSLRPPPSARPSTRPPSSLRDYKQALAIGDVEGEAGYNTMERTGVRPSLDVNGIWGGTEGGHQDRHPVESLGQDIDATGPQPGLPQDRPPLREALQGHRAQERQGQGELFARRHAPTWHRPTCRLQGSRKSHSRHLRQAASALLFGRLDTHHQRLRADARYQVAAHRLRPLPRMPYTRPTRATASSSSTRVSTPYLSILQVFRRGQVTYRLRQIHYAVEPIHAIGPTFFIFGTQGNNMQLCG